MHRIRKMTSPTLLPEPLLLPARDWTRGLDSTCMPETHSHGRNVTAKYLGEQLQPVLRNFEERIHNDGRH